MQEGLKKIRGTHHHKFDAKNRISVPAGWCPVPGTTLLMISFKQDDHAFIKVYTEEAFDEYEQSIRDNKELSVSGKQSYLSWLNSAVVETSINTQGKILVPKKMCDQANIPENVTIVGQRTYFELWNPQDFDKKHQLDESNVKTINDNHLFI